MMAAIVRNAPPRPWSDAASGVLIQLRPSLVVPVNALLALAGGGYAVETVDAAGVHKLVAVGLGLFDDAQGLVQLTDTTVVAGQHVVVPAS